MIGERGRILTRPLNPAERKLCEEHHHIIYDVMKRYHFTDPGLDVYGEFALALMDAAQKYIANERLRKFSFPAVAYQQIRNRVSSLCLEQSKYPRPSLDASCLDGDDTYGDRTPARNFHLQASESALTLYKQCTSQLTPKQLEALRMYGNGMTHSEIAATLEIPAGTVASRISAGRCRCASLDPND